LAPVPLILGDPKVGSLLTAQSGVWDSGVTFTYQWLLDGNPIPGQTTSTYKLIVSDAGRQISVRVTGSKTGFQSTQVQSGNFRIASLPTLLSTPTPTMSGTWRIGQELRVNTGVWDEGVILDYQWQRNSVNIRGAILPTYKLTNSDLNSTIGVIVTGSKVGFPRVSRTSPISPSNWAQTPLIVGQPRVGETLSADPGNWPIDKIFSYKNTTFTYQWLRNKNFIPGAVFSNYKLTESDSGSEISVSVTSKTPVAFTSRGASRWVSVNRVSNSVNVQVLPNLTSTPVPSIEGEAIFGKEGRLSVVTGQWDTDVNLSFTWLRNGKPIPGATNQNYNLSIEDIGQSLNVQVTGTKNGFLSKVVLSPTLKPTQLPALVLQPEPQISGQFTLGNLLTAQIGNWDIGVSHSYQWLRNGTPIQGATASTHTISQEDVTRRISVRISASKSGFLPVIKDSQSGLVPGTLTLTPKPQLNMPNGFEVGRTVSVNPGKWDSGVSVSYRWLRNGQPITGANSARYTITEADGGTSISAVVTGNKLLFFPVSLESDRFSPAVLKVFTSQPKPSFSCEGSVYGRIAGQCFVGDLARVTPGSWEPGVNLRYQWFRQSPRTGAQPILRATLSTYRISSLDASSGSLTAIWVEVTGEKLGYKPLSTKSQVNYPFAVRR
jgi:hypothetical protein